MDKYCSKRVLKWNVRVVIYFPDSVKSERIRKEDPTKFF